MTALVVDASALVFATTEASAAAGRLRSRLGAALCHAPHLIDAELGNILRRKAARRELDDRHALVVLAQAPLLIDRRYEHHGSLAASAWRLRGNLSFYDALYVALASALDVPLVTVDRRLAAIPTLPCRVEVPTET